MIGNAVPVTLGRAIRQSIAIHLRIEADKTKREEKGADADDARKFLVA